MFYIRWQLPAGGATNEALGEHIKLERQQQQQQQQSKKAEKREKNNARATKFGQAVNENRALSKDFPSSHMFPMLLLLLLLLLIFFLLLLL